MNTSTTHMPSYYESSAGSSTLRLFPQLVDQPEITFTENENQEESGTTVSNLNSDQHPLAYVTIDWVERI